MVIEPVHKVRAKAPRTGTKHAKVSNHCSHEYVTY